MNDGPPAWAASAVVASLLLLVILAVLALVVLLDPIPSSHRRLAEGRSSARQWVALGHSAGTLPAIAVRDSPGCAAERRPPRELELR